MRSVKCSYWSAAISPGYGSPKLAAGFGIVSPRIIATNRSTSGE